MKRQIPPSEAARAEEEVCGPISAGGRHAALGSAVSDRAGTVQARAAGERPLISGHTSGRGTSGELVMVVFVKSAICR